MKWSNFASFFLVILTFNISPAEGLKWISEPLPVNKCKGQTANFTWEYERDPNEEVSQLQWIFNRTELIAYSSLNQGFNVEHKYQGRVNQSGKFGVLLHNISSEDSGFYTLYPLVKWEEKPNIQTVQLNVIEEAMEPECSCKRFLDLLEERNGQSYRIKVGSCNLEIKASVCCPVGLVYQYCVNDPSTLCVPIGNHNNVTGSTTHSRIGNQGTNGAKELINILHVQHGIMISVLVVVIGVFCVIFIMMGALLHVFKINPWKKIKNLKNNGEALCPGYAEELHSLKKQDVRHKVNHEN